MPNGQSKSRPANRRKATPKSAVRRTGVPPKAKSKLPPPPRPTLGLWVRAARLRTLPLAVAAVVLGTVAAYMTVPVEYHPWRALAALVVALALQIGVNYANDYSDGIRGTDDERVGPFRITASRAVRPKTVRNVAFAFFGIAALAGLFLVWRSGQWWLIAVGAVCILAAWFYTGGKRPYGYAGLGELMVFVFFGGVAVLGTQFTQVGRIDVGGVIIAVIAGSFAVAVLIANNLRDISGDRASGKRTLAVLIGPLATRVLYIVFAIVPYALLPLFFLVVPAAAIAYFTLLLMLPAMIITALAKTAKELNSVLALTTASAMLYAVTVALFMMWPIG